uniref:Uncharacterized protein n=1 Tax=Rhizophora mucronata TaxID=61149 RepID=A0A2P2PRQ1_RHIMU
MFPFSMPFWLHVNEEFSTLIDRSELLVRKLISFHLAQLSFSCLF